MPREELLASDGDESGMTIERIGTALGDAGLRCLHVGEAFTMEFDGEAMPVVMGVGVAAGALE